MTGRRPSTSLTGAVLIGGKGSRMRPHSGPKHALVLPDGRTMLDHVIDALATVCGKVVLIGTTRSDSCRRYECLPDARDQQGPLGGIEALLDSNLDSEYLVCPCDLPLITPQFLRLLVSSDDDRSIARPKPSLATIVHLSDRVEPESLPARIRSEALPTVRSLLDSGQRAVWALMRSLPAHVVPISASWGQQLTNVNTLEDFEKLRAANDARRM